MTNTTRKKEVVWPPVDSVNWSAEERELLGQLSSEILPKHVAIIMDGNGRWAKSRGWKERIRGHEAGIDSVREATRTAAMLGLDYLTLFAFSKENWERPRLEVAALMKLLERFAIGEREELMENDVRLQMIGDLSDLPAPTLTALEKTIEMTRDNSGTTLVLALSYGGRDDIVRAARKVARASAVGEIDPDSIDEQSFAQYLDTSDMPDPDLLIRTSNEYRISNFLLWQIAYSEIHIAPVLWPDFRRQHMLEALVEYRLRDRRFGKLGESDLKQNPPVQDQAE